MKRKTKLPKKLREREGRPLSAYVRKEKTPFKYASGEKPDAIAVQKRRPRHTQRSIERPFARSH